MHDTPIRLGRHCRSHARKASIPRTVTAVNST